MDQRLTCRARRGRPQLTVEHILDEVAGGLTVDEFVASHPRLTREDIQAARAFAAESVRMERLGAVPRGS